MSINIFKTSAVQVIVTSTILVFSVMLQQQYWVIWL